ncbi:hypothetical protein Tsubulata_020747, partial [Turnera subulata]
MWTIVLCVVAVVVVCYTHWINKWRNPKCNVALPPGSMGLPLVGETLEFIIPSYSLDLHPFLKTRIQRYGPIFRTNLLGRGVVVSADPVFNHYLYQQEGISVEMWYLDTFSKVFGQSGESRTNATGIVHKYARSLILTHFGSENLKRTLLPHVETIVSKSLRSWSNHPSIEVKHALSLVKLPFCLLIVLIFHPVFGALPILFTYRHYVQMVCDFTANQLFSYDAEASSLSLDKLSENFTSVLDAFMSLPLNIPGTKFHKCLKDKEKVLNFLKNVLREKMDSPPQLRGGGGGDFLDQVVADMDKEKFLTQDLVINMVFGILFASLESISGMLTLALKLLREHPSVMEALTSEHEAILRKREDRNAPLTWAEYNSMTFTLNVINETLRIGNVGLGVLRRALKDIQVKEYTIPAGWVILVANSALHMNPTTFKDPQVFNPWRWKEFDSNNVVVSKDFVPFGGGKRQCAGSDFTKLLMSIFLHYVVTRYRWTIIKEGKLARNPIFGPIFRTNILGRPIVVSGDPEFNNYIIQQEGKSVEMWYMDSFSKLFAQSGESRTNAFGIIHKYARSLTLTHFGSESLKGRLLPHVQDIITKTLNNWSSLPSVEVKHAISVMVCDFTAKQLFSYDAETSSENISEKFASLIDVFMSLPLNIPGTKYHKCLKDKERTQSILKQTLKERMESPELRRGDFLDQVIADMDKENFESISAATALALKLIDDRPLVLEELTAEHEAIVKNRENPDSPLTWAEYESMTFTRQVVNETLRLGNVAPGLLRRAIEDLNVKGYTIPAGWVIMLVNSAIHLNPTTFKDPLEFNPWRWKEFNPYTVSKNLMPFGGGKRQCAGSEFTKLFMATFLHFLVTKYRWTIIKKGNIRRNPILGFGEGIHISFTPKGN